MESLAVFLDQYGGPTLLGLLALSNAGRIAGWAARLVGKVWPSFAEARRLKIRQAREREKQGQIAAERERLDTILALKNMLLAYRQALDDANLERRQLQNRLYELVERYERHDAQFVEVLRDIGGAIRAQTERLDRMAVRLGVYDRDERAEIGD